MNGSKLKELRESNGMTQRDVSIATGLTEATIGKLEGGKGNPTLKTVQKLADVFKVPIGDLLND